MADEFRRMLNQKIKSIIQSVLLNAVVTSVEDVNMTCDVKLSIDDLPLYDVRLTPQINAGSNGIVPVPAIGSAVIVGFLDNNIASAFIVNVQEADKVIIRGGSLGGLVKIQELTKQLERDRDLMKAILQVVNGAPVTEPGNGSPSALQIAMKSAVAGKQQADYSKIENDKITHG